MKFKLLMGAAVMAGALGLAGASAAAEFVTMTNVQDGNVLPAGFTLITDFNGAADHGAITDLAPGFSFSQDNDAYIRLGSEGLDPGISAPPPGDTGYYETVLGGGSATLTSVRGLKAFSFYLGSPDDYNNVTFKFTDVNGTTFVLSGPQIWGGPSLGGNQSIGKTVTYKFGPDAVKSIQFTSSGNSFEFDTLGGVGVPEPSSWALMIGGFGLAGATLRARRKAQAAAA
jgi:hypothetical protein